VSRALSRALLVVLACAPALTVCTKEQAVVPSVPVQQLPGHGSVGIDLTRPRGLRLVPTEAYLRTYLRLFGGLAPLDVQEKAKGKDGAALFDAWTDYLTALGLPDHRHDQPRAEETNAMMIATFERIGVALCDRAAEDGNEAVFPFALDAHLDAATFGARFDLVHRTFLGYPAALAETERTARFFALYEGVVKRHEADPPKGARLPPGRAAGAAVCEGLIRHPEFHLY
jgi:hypothetical protein